MVNTAVIQRPADVFMVGQRIRVVQGIFASRAGIVQRIMDRNEVFVMLEKSKNYEQEWVRNILRFVADCTDDSIGRTSLSLFRKIEGRPIGSRATSS